MRYARKADSTQAEVVAAIRAVGWQVWFIGEPVDLLCFRAGEFRCLEVKSPRNKAGDPVRDKRRVAQDAFIAATGTPRVTSGAQAIAALSRGSSVKRQDTTNPQ